MEEPKLETTLPDILSFYCMVLRVCANPLLVTSDGMQM